MSDAANPSDFERVWSRVLACAGLEFHQVRGKPFTYQVTNGSILPSTTNRLIPKSQFAVAFERMPVSGPGALMDLQGPSYLYAILGDPRVA